MKQTVLQCILLHTVHVRVRVDGIHSIVHMLIHVLETVLTVFNTAWWTMILWWPPTPLWAEREPPVPQMRCVCVCVCVCGRRGNLLCPRVYSTSPVLLDSCVKWYRRRCPILCIYFNLPLSSPSPRCPSVRNELCRTPRCFRSTGGEWF